MVIGEKDWRKVEDFVKKERDRRKQDSFRKEHEAIWREVDRQVAMKALRSVDVSGQPVQNDWHTYIELGELSTASEILTADTARILFPSSRTWFEPHIELPIVLDDVTGEKLPPDPKKQQYEDGKLRALMSQQHMDFGIKPRIQLSIKEALHHGSYVVEVRQERMMMVTEDANIREISAPVWVPHSMWNCYPDPSPSVLAANMFYEGSMVIMEYMPLHQLKSAAVGDGWMAGNIAKIKRRRNKNKDVDTEDVELTKWFGTIVISRSEGDIVLPNSKAILANDTIVYYAPNTLPVPPIIFNGYERMDVRDPYYTSPLIKLSPIQKLASQMAAKFNEGIALKVEPPLLYDGNDPTFAMNGGPVVAPGWKGATKGSAEWSTMDVGDPSYALQGLELALNQLQKGTSVDAIRAGASGSADRTAEEIRTTAARSEIRIVDFVDKVETSLRTFLYLQHKINKAQMGLYSFYNPEMDAPDFMWMNGKELVDNVHFEIVGSKGVLGEQQRAQKTMEVTAFAASQPLFQNLLKPIDILKDMYQDAGNKSPERFLNLPDDESQIIEEQIRAEYEEQMQAHQEQIMQLQKDLAISKAVSEAKMLEVQMKAKTTSEVTMFKANVQSQLDILKAALDKQGEQEESIGEIQGVIDVFKQYIEQQKENQTTSSEEMASKLQQMNNSLQKVIEKMSKPIKIKVNRDQKGRMAELEGSRD